MALVREDLERGIVVEQNGSEKKVGKGRTYKGDRIFRFSSSRVKIESEEAVIELSWLQMMRLVLYYVFYRETIYNKKEVI